MSKAYRNFLFASALIAALAGAAVLATTNPAQHVIEVASSASNARVI